MTSVDDQPVMKTRQKSAFPPNFVHSLDSTHMMLTALRCGAEHDMAFAAVHDSYWTHGCDIPVMNQILREEFVNLHSQPLLENLRSDFWLRHPDVDLPKLPDMGDLDLQEMRLCLQRSPSLSLRVCRWSRIRLTSLIEVSRASNII